MKQTLIAATLATSAMTGTAQSDDIVTVQDGLITRIDHLEDWTGAIAQLTAD